MRGLYVRTEPYAAWKTNSGLYLTAIKIVNTSDEPVEFHLRKLSSESVGGILNELPIVC